MERTKDLVNSMWKSKLSIFFLIMTFLQPMEAVDFFWNVPIGDWAVGANWNPAGPPAAGDNAFINNGGTSNVTAGANTSNLLFVGSPVGTDLLNIIGGTLTNSSSTIGINSTDRGVITLAGTAMWTTSLLTVANAAGSTGILNLNLSGNLTSIAISGGNGNSTINFNGAAVRAVSSNGSFISNFTQANVLAGGMIIDTQNFNVGIPQNLTGNGTVTKIGTGLLTLIGPNNLTGNMVVKTGFLRGSTASLPTGDAEVTGVLVFLQEVDGTYAGSISGPGIVLKQNNGKLQLTGNSSGFTGTAAVQQGELNVNGILGGTTVVGSTGLLSGTGFLGNLTNGGIVSPGNPPSNPIGTLHVNNFTNGVNGRYISEISPAGFPDQIAAAGTATLNGGTLTVLAQPGIYLQGTRYTLINALGGLTGQFATAILPANVPSFLSYLPNQLILTVLASVFNTTGLSGNALRVAEYIRDHVPASPDFLTVIAALNTLDTRQLQKALDQLHPALFQAFPYTTENNAHMINSTFTDRLDFLRNGCNGCCDDACDSCACSCGGIWFSGVGDFFRQNRTQGLRSFKANTGGVALGYDTTLDSILAGVGAGYSFTNLHWRHSIGRSYINGFYVGGYATKCNDFYYIDATLLGFINHYRTRRHIHFADLHRKPRSHHYGYGFNPHLGLGIYLDVCSVNVIPFCDFDYYLIQQNRLREHKAGSINLHVKRNQSSIIRVETGVKFSKCFDLCGGTLQPNASISYVGHRLTSGKKYISAFEDVDEDFSVFGTNHCFNQLEVGLGVSYLINDKFAVNAWYDVELGHKREEQEVNLEVSYCF